MRFDCPKNVIRLERDDNLSLCCPRYATREIKVQGYTKRDSRLFDPFLEPKDSFISTRGETMTYHKWIVSQEVDECWLVGAIMKDTMPDLFNKVLRMYYKERQRLTYEDMK